MLYIGIDPGASGGIAVLQRNMEPTAWVIPCTEKDTYDQLHAISDGASLEEGGAFCVIEQVHSMPKQGVASSFKFGVSYGGLRMALVACGIPFETVTPGQWQRSLHCLSGGDKNVTKRRAQELFPNVKITHRIADALLLAEYCRRIKCPSPQTTLSPLSNL